MQSERDEQREFAFGLRQILDIGVKALSPGINDPTTAMVSLRVATRTLAAAAGSTSIEQARRGDYGGVIVPRASWSELVFSTFDQFATYGSNDVQVARTIIGSAKRLIALAPSEIDNTRLADMLDSIEHHVSEASLLESERRRLDAEIDGCRRLLDRHPEARLGEFRSPRRTI